MKRADVLRKLRAERESLRERYGVESLALFGSVARDEARPDSDVDLLVEFGRPITLFDLVAVQGMVVDAVIRNFQVIGEAVRHVPDEVQARYPEVPWSLMQGMRHILVHDYYAVKLDVVWRTIQQSLPPLLGPLRRILAENP